METSKQNKNNKKRGRKTAAIAGTVCSAVMLLSGGAVFAGCGDNQPSAKNGLSAYEIAVKYGYEGTEEQWVRDLQGLKGDQGPRGDDGRSAYEIAKDRGYNGTEADWLASISGGEGVGVQSVNTETDKWGIKTKFTFTLTNSSTIEAFTTVVDPLRDYVADNTQDVALLESYGVKAEHIKMSASGTYSASSTEDLMALVNAGVDLTDPSVEIDTTKTYAATSIEELAALNTVVQNTALQETNISTDSATFEADSIADLQLLDQYDVAATQVTIDTTKQYAAADTDTVLLAMDYNVPAANVNVNKEEFYNVGTAQVGANTVADEVVTKLINVGVEKIKLTDNIELSSEFQIPDGTTIQNSANLASKYSITEPAAYKTNVMFDLNGNTLSTSSASCLIVKKDVFASFVNGTINLVAADELDSTIVVQDGGKLVLNNITYTSTGTNVQVFGQAILDIKDSTLNGKTYCVATDDSDIKNAGANVFIKDSTLSVNGTDYDDTAMFVGLPTYVVLDGCTVNANRQAMIIRGGDVEIKDSTITTTAQHSKKTDYRDGAWATGNEVPMAAIVLGDRYATSNGTYDANLILSATSVVSGNASVPTIYAWGQSANNKANIVLNIEGTEFNVANYGIASASINDNAAVNALVSTAEELNAALNAGLEVIDLEADIIPETAISINRSVTINGADHKLKANISGDGTIVFNNIYTTNIIVAEAGFTGTLKFYGGKLDTDRPGSADSAAAFYSSSNNDASFEFHNMEITANITKGIKIYNAKNVVIDNCEFDATKLAIMEDALNSDRQSLSLVDIQIGTGSSPTNITITGCYFEGSIQGSIAVPESIYGAGNGSWADSDTGAAIKIKAENGVQFGTVVITGNTFKDNYRDVLVGTGPYANQLQMAANAASNGRSGDGLQYNKIDDWTIEDNTTTITSQVAENRGVATLSYIGGPSPFNKYTTYVGNVGEVVGGCGIWVIADAFEKVDDVWYYKENGELYSVIVNAGLVTFANVWDGTAGELPTEVENTYTITTAKQFAAIAAAVNAGNTFEGKTIKLSSDIDLVNIEWTPIGYGSCDHDNFDSNQSGPRFMGTFDGQNHTIYNLSITNFPYGGEQNDAAGGIGLFGQVVNGTIQNVNIDGAEIIGNHYVGALAGFVLYSTIDNCSVINAEVSCTFANSDDSGDKAGALVGYIAGDNGVATITNCSAEDSTVNADRDAGQVIGCTHAVTETGNTATNVTVSGNNTSGTEKSGQNINNTVVGRIV